MKPSMIAGALGFVLVLIPSALVLKWTGNAEARLEEAEAVPVPVPVATAAAANEDYCTPQLKQVLRRVLQSCGLIEGGGRGCQPVQARNIATMDDQDFNALFVPMRERGGILEYEQSSAELDAADKALIDRVFAERRGASYFFVVARASPEGSEDTNRELSRGRAEAVLAHLEESFGQSADLQNEVGLLWLGEEYAQLDASFCDWNRSGDPDSCEPDELNRSAFVAWIDCRL
mgnify:CR=1 FL=1